MKFYSFIYSSFISFFFLFLLFVIGSCGGGVGGSTGNGNSASTSIIPLCGKTTVQSSNLPAGITGDSELEKQISGLYPNAEFALCHVSATATGEDDGTSWDNAYKNVKTALEKITDASATKVYLVLVAEGTYDEDKIQMKNHVAIIGGWSQTGNDTRPVNAKTILDGNNSHRVFDNRFTQNEPLTNTALLYGVTVTGGVAEEEEIEISGTQYKYYLGGGMWNIFASPTLSHITFLNNYAATAGGGMFNNASSPVLTEVTFSRNSAKDAGGGMRNLKSTPELSDVIFSDNSADSGGGIDNYQSSPILTNVTFSNNSANFAGGGMYNDESPPILTNVTFSNNLADSGGGIDNYQSSPIFIDVTFADNSADLGGAMNNNESFPQLTNVIFSGNKAKIEGGGMRNEGSLPLLVNVTFADNKVGEGLNNSYSGSGGGMSNNGSSPAMINVTFFKNTAEISGGGIYNLGKSGPGPLIINSLFWENSSLSSRNSDSTKEQQIYFGGTNEKKMHLLHGVLEHGIGDNSNNAPLQSGVKTSQVKNGGLGSSTPLDIAITFNSITNISPGLDSGVKNNGGKIKTPAISSGSAENTGVYIRRSVQTTDTFEHPYDYFDGNGQKINEPYSVNVYTFYYSTDNTTWTELSIENGNWVQTPGVALPPGTVDLTATDARGYSRSGRPDIGAYELNGTAPATP